MPKDTIYPPLRLTQLIGKNFPKAFEQIEDIRTHKSELGDAWFPDSCYIPIGATQACVEAAGYDISSPAEGIVFAVLLAAVAPWRQNKVSYQFSKELEELLFEQADDIKIPTETLDALPYPCIYIETKTLPFHGFLVHREYDVNTKQEELRFVFISESGKAIPQSMHLLNGKTISDCMQDSFAQSMRNAFLKKDIYGAKVIGDLKDSPEAIKMIQKCMQLILYICAENAEINENPMQKRVYRKDKTIKDAYREIRKWDVGFKTGQLIRKARKSMEAAPKDTQEVSRKTSEHAPARKRPHSRRAHWHHYRVGEGRKKLILKWIAPMFINSEEMDEDALPVSVIKIDE